jgi:hypothetical protein
MGFEFADGVLRDAAAVFEVVLRQAQVLPARSQIDRFHPAGDAGLGAIYCQGYANFSVKSAISAGLLP